MARRVENQGRNRFSDFFLCSLPVAITMAFLYVLVTSFIFGFYTPDVPSSFGTFFLDRFLLFCLCYLTFNGTSLHFFKNVSDKESNLIGKVQLYHHILLTSIGFGRLKRDHHVYGCFVSGSWLERKGSS